MSSGPQPDPRPFRQQSPQKHEEKKESPRRREKGPG